MPRGSSPGRLVPIVLLILGSACIGWGDALHTPRRISGAYGLFHTESGHYKLDGPNKPGTDAGGLVDGTIDSLGWNDTLIVARRLATFRAEGDGWMLVNMRSGQITGPHPDSVRIAVTQTTGIRLISAGSAYQELR